MSKSVGTLDYRSDHYWTPSRFLCTKGKREASEQRETASSTLQVLTTQKSATPVSKNP